MDHQECPIDMLFSKSVPHVLEKIFFSLDYESFKNCQDVCNAWKESLTSKHFQKKARSVYFYKIKQEDYKLHASKAEKHGDEKTLAQSSYDGNIDSIKSLLSKGVDPNCVAIIAVKRLHLRWQDATPLFSAVLKSHIDVARLLIEAGADPNIAHNSGESPLYMAAVAVGDHISMVKLLIERGANLNTGNSRLINPLHGASIFGRTEVVKVLIDAGADPYKADCLPTYPNHLEVTKLLINARAEALVERLRQRDLKNGR